MIDSIRNLGAVSHLSASGSGQKLTEDQISQIKSILSDYDASALTAEDAQNIGEAFKEAGITPGRELAAAMKTFGFDAKEIGDLVASSTNEGVKPPPPPAQGGSLNAESMQTLYDILDQYDLINMSEDDEIALTQSLKKSGLFTTGTLFNGFA